MERQEQLPAAPSQSERTRESILDTAQASNQCPVALQPIEDDEDEVEYIAQSAAGPPQQWYFNYDHNDPLNYGFMFPVQPDSPASKLPLPAPLSVPLGSPVATGLVLDLERAIQDNATVVTQPLPHRLDLQPDDFSIPPSPPNDVSLSSWSTPTSTTLTSAGPDTVASTPATKSSPESHVITNKHSVSRLKRKRVSGNSTPEPESSLQERTTSPSVGPAQKRTRQIIINPNRYPSNVNYVSVCKRCQNPEKRSTSFGVCNDCIHASSFYAWPSVVGSRRENFESLTLFLLPTHAEDYFRLIPRYMPKTKTWRMLSREPSRLGLEFGIVGLDPWSVSIMEARSTGLFGDEYAELANIARGYQKSLAIPNRALDAACQVLISTCQLYKCFVAVPGSNPADLPEIVPVLDLLDTSRDMRIKMRQAFKELQSFALAPSNIRDRQDWFPSFLSACILAITAVIFLDILIACPSPYKEYVWGGSWQAKIAEMRNGGYGMLLNVLRVNTKGVNPMKMSCWSDEIASANSEAAVSEIKLLDARYHNKSEHRILLGAHSPAALSGILRLKAWEKRYSNDLKQGKDMFSQDLYRLAVTKPVAGLWKVFEMEQN